MSRILYEIFDGIQITHDPETGEYFVQGQPFAYPCAEHARLAALLMAPNTDIPEELPSLN